MISFGPHRIHPPVMPAPIEGLTDEIYFGLLEKLGGVGWMISPFERVTATAPNKKKLRRRRYRPLPRFSQQLLGADPKRMAEAANLFAAAGAWAIDINFGCPSPTVTSKGAGAACLDKPDLVFAIVDRVKRECPLPLSVKTRIGNGGDELFERNMEAIVGGGADMLILHSRNRRDLYHRPARWDYIARAVELAGPTIPVIGNGDIWTVADARRMIGRTGCQGVMIGRAMLRDPYIVSLVAADLEGQERQTPGAGERVRFFHRWARLAQKGGLSERSMLGRLKTCMAYLGGIVNDEGRFKTRLLRAKRVSSLLMVLDELEDYEGIFDTLYASDGERH